MSGHFDPLLVLLSVVLGAAASFTALNVAERMFKASERARKWWLLASATALGVGIWSLHFVGMLAFVLPVPLVYGWPLTVASLALAIGSSVGVMLILSRRQLTWPGAAVAAGSLATGVCLMHYTGMAAIEVAPAISYDPALVAASALVALAVATASLTIIYYLRQGRIANRVGVRLAIAIVMGLTIAGMHYTGMAAAHFDAATICTSETGVDSAWLAGAVAFFTLMLMGMGVVSAIVDSHMADQQQHFNRSLTASNESLRRANDELARLANHDSLTGLPNRARIFERLEKLIAACSLETGRVAVMFVDLDRFKSINDTLGHHVGDQLLVAAARRLVEVVGSEALVGRLGGDEFVVLTAYPQLQQIADRGHAVLDALIRSFTLDDHEVFVGASVGVAVYPEDARSARDLLICADTAMYQAKQSGGDRLLFYSPLVNEAAGNWIERENGLERVLRQGQFELYYQPKIDVTSGRVTSYEALLRWRHPERGMIPPADFIPLAERNGMIVQIGEWVLHEACRQAAAWQTAGVTAPRVSINISARQFRDNSFPDAVERALRRSALPPELLGLELTEATVLEQPDRSVETLTRLSKLGVQIAIDDFGTGYSSLPFLRRLPLDKLKIDRSFVQGLAAGSQDTSIVSAIISMAHSLDLEVIAEGVETVDQLSILRDLGCDQFQGFLFSPPLVAGQAIELLDREPLTMPAPQTRVRWTPSRLATHALSPDGSQTRH